MNMPQHSHTLSFAHAHMQESKCECMRTRTHPGTHSLTHSLTHWVMLQAGALGFKSFLSPSGINDFENVSRSDVGAAMHFLLSKGAPYFVHAELVSDVEQTEVCGRMGWLVWGDGRGGGSMGGNSWVKPVVCGVGRWSA
jgi:hypothetical protein